MDLLSDILETARIRGGLYFGAAFSGPWAARIPKAARQLRFHIVLDGQCWLRVDGLAEPRLLRQGDMAVVPHGASQVLSDRPGRIAVDLDRVLSDAGYSGHGELRIGDPASGPVVRMVCGSCSFDEGLRHPLFDSLPPMICLAMGEAPERRALAAIFRLLSHESVSAEPGHGAVANRLFEILLAQIMREQIRERDLSADGDFLAALAVPPVARALSAMHAAPQRPWTLQELANEAALSRSRFAEVFAAAVGLPPQRYLTQWRLQKAYALLRDGGVSVAEAAYRVGYESLPSFTRGFRNQFGIGPGALRRTRSPGRVSAAG